MNEALEDLKRVRSPKELDRADKAISLIIREFARATSMNGAFHSAHEGYAVILEELDELKEEVWKKAVEKNKTKVQKKIKDLLKHIEKVQQ